MTLEETNKGGKMLQKIIDEIIEAEPVSLYNYLLKLGAILGYSSELVKYGEYYYKEYPKDSKACALRVYTQALDKNLHYRIESIRSVLSSVREDSKFSKYQT